MKDEKIYKKIVVLFIFVLVWTMQISAKSLPSDPNNAALLYYQALLLKPEQDTETFELIRGILDGDEPNDSIREYLKSCNEMFKIIEAATQIQNCDWGALYSQGQELNMIIIGQLRQLNSLLRVYARTLAADGDYRQAIDWTLKIRQIGKHIGDDTFMMYAMSQAFERSSLATIKHVLESMSPDSEILTWLQEQLTIQDSPQSPARVLKNDLELALNAARRNPTNFNLWRLRLATIAQLPYSESWIESVPENLIPKTINEDDLQVARGMLSLTDQKKNDIQELLVLSNEKLLERYQQWYNQWLNSVTLIIESDMIYQKKIEELRKIEENKQSPPFDPFSFITVANPDVIDLYSVFIRDEVYFKAIRAATKIYLVFAETGKLPDEFPRNLLKDPYSGQDFEYEITDDGFILRCQVKDIGLNVQQYEFKVKKQNQD
jgi:hypothetical protein